MEEYLMTSPEAESLVVQIIESSSNEVEIKSKLGEAGWPIISGLTILINNRIRIKKADMITMKNGDTAKATTNRLDGHLTITIKRKAE